MPITVQQNCLETKYMQKYISRLCSLHKIYDGAETRTTTDSETKT